MISLQKPAMAAGINICLTVVVGVLLCNGVTAYPGGAPSQACGNMTPSHLHYTPSTLPAPFTIAVDPVKFIVGEPVKGECRCLLTANKLVMLC